jgi:hypothetical protein
MYSLICGERGVGYNLENKNWSILRSEYYVVFDIVQ